MKSKPKLKSFYNVPMVYWSSTAERLEPEQLMELEREAVVHAVHYARLSEYLSCRHGCGCGDQGHDDAVKAQNKVAAKVRRALGFTLPRQDISF